MNDLLLVSLKESIISVALAVLFFWILKITYQRVSNWILCLIGVLPAIFIYLWNPDFRVYGVHGFMHISIVYQILNGNIPPNNPLLAGKPLLYPWGPHLLVAGIAYVFHISPAISFALLNVCFLLLTLILVFKIAVFIHSDRIAGVFATFLSIFGITFFIRGPIAIIFAKIDSLVDIKLFRMERAAIPIFTKFISSGANNQFGILIFALFLYSMLQIFSKRKKIQIFYFILSISVIATAFFYTLYLPALIANCLACCLVMYFYQGRMYVRKIVRVITCMIFSTIVMLPYLHQIISGKSKEAAITLALLNMEHFVLTSLTYFMVILAISLVLAWKHKTLLKILRAKTSSVLILISIIITTALMWIFLISPTGIEYKYLILSCFSLGILSSICFRDLYFNNRFICFVIITSFLLPMSSLILKRLDQLPITDEYIEQGTYLLHKDKNENNLYSYISSQTSPNSIFIDSQLTIPVFGRRQLYVGLDTRKSNFDRPMHNGWGKAAKGLLREQGYPPKMIEARRKIANLIYSDANNKVSENVVKELTRIKNTDDVYVVARDAVTDNKLVKDDRFSKVFKSDETTVYKLL